MRSAVAISVVDRGDEYVRSKKRAVCERIERARLFPSRHDEDKRERVLRLFRAFEQRPAPEGGLVQDLAHERWIYLVRPSRRLKRRERADAPERGVDVVIITCKIKVFI